MTLTFEEAEAKAIMDSTCFCMCGCRDFAAPGAILGVLVPGTCTRCASKGHERIANYAMYDAFINPLFEGEVVEPLPRVVDPGPIVVPIYADGSEADTPEKRLTLDHYAVGVNEDLTSLRIPKSVADGTYMVRIGRDTVRVDIERPTWGWVIAKLTLDDGVVHYGVQRPWSRNYRGWWPQVIAKVIEGDTWTI